MISPLVAHACATLDRALLLTAAVDLSTKLPLLVLLAAPKCTKMYCVMLPLVATPVMRLLVANGGLAKLLLLLPQVSMTLNIRVQRPGYPSLQRGR